MDRHEAAVDSICSQIGRFYDSKLGFRVYHGSTNSTRHAHFDQDAIVDVSALNNIISIDQQKQIAIVEPNVPMDALVRETMKVGLLPPVVMEFPGITVGGGFVGTAGESSSFKYGFFDRTVLSAEVVLANGQMVRASETSNQELFEGLRGSFGTLGVLTMVEMRLIHMQDHVEVTYHPTTSISHAMETLQVSTKDLETDYIDGILFSKNSGAIITGRLTSQPPSSSPHPLCRFSRPWDEWFYIHAQHQSTRPDPTTELVPLQDYLFRYDRGAFWTGMYAFRYFMLPFTRLTRFLMDYFMHTRIMYHALHASGHTDHYIIQDVALPAGNAGPFISWLADTMPMWPLWLCPLRRDARVSMGHPRAFTGTVGGSSADGSVFEGEYINVGVWGPYLAPEVEYVRANRALENKVAELGGLKWLYSRVFYTEDEWWKIYNREEYERLRGRFDASSLPSIWEKVRDRGKRRVAATGVKGWVKRIMLSNGLLSGAYGVWKAVRGGDYMLRKKTA